MTITLTVTAKGQITLRKEVLKHLGVQPGDKLNVDLLKDGRMQIRPKRGKSAEPISRHACQTRQMIASLHRSS